jgi:hypothetical protein
MSSSAHTFRTQHKSAHATQGNEAKWAHLWRDVVRSATDGVKALGDVLGEPEVGEFDVGVGLPRREQKVLRLHIVHRGVVTDMTTSQKRTQPFLDVAKVSL